MHLHLLIEVVQPQRKQRWITKNVCLEKMRPLDMSKIV
jgi:hypothetical protein